jgi:NAD-dependent deacetylase
MFQKAAQIIRRSHHLIAFTGAGISVESGVPPFRGTGGIWDTYDPSLLEIGTFLQNPSKSWEVIRTIFYDHLGDAKPNDAHFALAALEREGLLKAIITQNIDNLHLEAGNTQVFEFHGNSKHLVCLDCSLHTTFDQISLDRLPPSCPDCQGLLKPDFVFFGEAIPEPARSNSFSAAEKADVVLVIGTSGEVMPAAMIPMIAKERGAIIIEVNTNPSGFTRNMTDVFLEGPATTGLGRLLAELGIPLLPNGETRRVTLPS